MAKKNEGNRLDLRKFITNSIWSDREFFCNGTWELEWRHPRNRVVVFTVFVWSYAMPFDVLGGGLVVKGTQQELVHILLTVSYRKHGSHDTSGMPCKIPAVRRQKECHIVPSFLCFGFKLCTWSGRICRSGVLSKCLLRITADLIRSRALHSANYTHRSKS